MRALLAVVLLAPVIAGLDLAPLGCTEGSSWFDGCNQCSCINGLPACTLKACLGESREGRCVDGSRWSNDGCNWCNCVNGRAICTRRACPPQATALLNKGRSLDENPTVSDPDCEVEDPEKDRWRQDCNWCKCSAAGRGLCTLRGCPQALKEQLAGQPQCEGKARWKVDGCNWCTCNNGIGMCTKKACGIHLAVPVAQATPRARSISASEITCEVGEEVGRWRQDCNWCRCLGGESACTKRGCPPGFRESLAGTPECEGTVRWKKDCNWCSCVDGVGVCTLRACFNREDFPALSRSRSLDSQTSDQEEVTPPEPNCEAETEVARWRVGCNWCHCQNGQGACTIKACLPEFDEQSSNEPECEGSVAWKKDCNWCSCKGGISVCTRRACRPQVLARPAAAVRHFECSRGSSWHDGCNRCTCANGLALCSLKFCTTKSEETCVGNSRWKKDCNWCSCVDGKPVCSKRACPQSSPKPDAIQLRSSAPKTESIEVVDVAIGVPRERDCVPGSGFSLDGCNYCICTPGGIPQCSMKLCEGDAPSTKTCEEGARWKDDCNWCDCRNGIGVCTRMLCDAASIRPVAQQETDEVTLGEKDECAVGSHFKRDCNWCTCTNGLGVCTRMACDPHEPEEEEQCKPGALWRQGCNTCICSDEGKAMCTLKACISGRNSIMTSTNDALDSQLQEETEKERNECRPGSKWRVACNWCTCSSKGQKMCTRRKCNPDEDYADTPQCIGDAYFLDEDNCNYCTCQNGFAACTLMYCFKPEEKLQVAAASEVQTATAAAEEEETPTAVECLEGSSWTSDCNYCYCNKGRSVCTRRACFTASERIAPTEAEEDRCSKSTDSGPCFGSFTSYSFNLERNRCEMFIYGGCGGNNNRFSSAEECLNTCGGEPPVSDSECDRRFCPEVREIEFMRAKGCTPQYDDGSCCATGFQCTETPSVRSEGQCVYKGTTYSLGDSIPGDPCQRCRCSVSGITCASVDCPSLFHPRKVGCRGTFALDKCCSTGDVCDQEEEAMCHWAGKDYYEGDKIFFKEAACQKCICSPNFTGPFGQSCKPIECHYETIYASKLAAGCVPKFFKERCCPIDFVCPTDSSVAADQSSANPEVPTENNCWFGDHAVAVGKTLVTSFTNVKCTCNTPPTVTCVQTTN